MCTPERIGAYGQTPVSELGIILHFNVARFR